MTHTAPSHSDAMSMVYVPRGAVIGAFLTHAQQRLGPATISGGLRPRTAVSLHPPIEMIFIDGARYLVSHLAKSLERSLRTPAEMYELLEQISPVFSAGMVLRFGCMDEAVDAFDAEVLQPIARAVQLGCRPGVNLSGKAWKALIAGNDHVARTEIQRVSTGMNTAPTGTLWMVPSGLFLNSLTMAARDLADELEGFAREFSASVIQDGVELVPAEGMRDARALTNTLVFKPRFASHFRQHLAKQECELRAQLHRFREEAKKELQELAVNRRLYSLRLGSLSGEGGMRETFGPDDPADSVLSCPGKTYLRAWASTAALCIAAGQPIVETFTLKHAKAARAGWCKPSLERFTRDVTQQIMDHLGWTDPDDCKVVEREIRSLIHHYRGLGDQGEAVMMDMAFTDGDMAFVEEVSHDEALALLSTTSSPLAGILASQPDEAAGIKWLRTHVLSQVMWEKIPFAEQQNGGPSLQRFMDEADGYIPPWLGLELLPKLAPEEREAAFAWFAACHEQIDGATLVATPGFEKYMARNDLLKFVQFFSPELARKTFFELWPEAGMCRPMLFIELLLRMDSGVARSIALDPEYRYGLIEDVFAHVLMDLSPPGRRTKLQRLQRAIGMDGWAHIVLGTESHLRFVNRECGYGRPVDADSEGYLAPWNDMVAGIPVLPDAIHLMMFCSEAEAQGYLDRLSEQDMIAWNSEGEGYDNKYEEYLRDYLKQRDAYYARVREAGLMTE